MKNLKTSMRYARALFLAAEAEGKTEAVMEDLTNIVKLIRKSSDFKMLINSPIIKLSKKKAIFEMILNGKILTITYDFLILLLNKGREQLIKDISICYGHLLDEYCGRIACQIVSAKELTDVAKTQILQFVENHTKLKAIPEYSIDSKLIGGMQIKIDNWVYDATVKNRLKNLKRSFIK